MNVSKNLYAPRCYAAFNRRIDAVTPWITSKVQPFCGYAAHKVTWRFRQRCTELAVPAFMRACVVWFGRTGLLPADTERVDCSGLRFETDRSVTLSLGLFLRAFAEFVLHWLHALAAILLCLRLRPSDTASITLAFGIGTENLIADGSDARFLAYCRHGPIVPLVEAEMLVVQAVQRVTSTEPDRVRYHRFPLFAALRWRGLGPLAWLRALTSHVVALVSFGWSVMRCPSAIILWRDAAYHAAAAALDRAAGLRAVVLTNSNNASQPLWMTDLQDRRFRTHMVHYSQNSIPIVYAADPVRSNFPGYRHIRVDVSWVWTEGYAKYLKGIGVPGEIHPVGPILWYLLRPAPTDSEYEDIRIAVFDVTPIRNDVELRIGEINNYYSTANMIRFIEDILYACAKMEQATGKRVRILLKHKRTYKPDHDQDYISLIEKISGPGQAVELLPPDANMYSLISGCDLTLVIPYSSPAFVATSLGCQAIYYDPTMELQPVYDKQPFLTFVAGRDNLVNALRRVLDSGLTKAAEVRSAHAKF